MQTSGQRPPLSSDAQHRQRPDRRCVSCGVRPGIAGKQQHQRDLPAGVGRVVKPAASERRIRTPCAASGHGNNRVAAPRSARRLYRPRACEQIQLVAAQLVRIDPVQTTMRMAREGFDDSDVRLARRRCVLTRPSSSCSCCRSLVTGTSVCDQPDAVTNWPIVNRPPR
jgi:hypothetical protein